MKEFHNPQRALKKKLRHNEAECLNKVYFPKSFRGNILFIKLDECPYIFLCQKGKKKERRDLSYSQNGARLFGNKRSGHKAAEGGLKVGPVSNNMK